MKPERDGVVCPRLGAVRQARDGDVEPAPDDRTEQRCEEPAGTEPNSLVRVADDVQPDEDRHDEHDAEGNPLVDPLAMRALAVVG